MEGVQAFFEVVYGDADMIRPTEGSSALGTDEHAFDRIGGGK